MKKVLFTLVALLISAIVIYGGSGVNMYLFCCDDCRIEGTAAFIEHKCCEIHHHHHSDDSTEYQEDYLRYLNIHDSHSECGIERVSVNWTYSIEKKQDLNPVIIFLPDLVLFAGISNLSLIDDSQSNNFKRKSQQPPDLSKEVYFNLLTTLII